MSDQSDSQNKSEEQVQMSEGSDPSSTSHDGSRSTPSNLPKAATRQRKKRTSDSEDEDYVAEEEATSKRVPMSKARSSTAETSKPTEGAVGEGKKRKERVKKTTARVLGRSSIMKDSEE